MKVEIEVESGKGIDVDCFAEALEDHLLGIEIDVRTRTWDESLGVYEYTTAVILSVSAAVILP